jgi:ubiquinone/menaquinone biosynthesis C-methylase UbiE
MIAEVNPFSDPERAARYESWYQGAGRRPDRLEKALLTRLLDWIGGAESLLDVGTGTGHFARHFDRVGLQVVGVDVSLPMLLQAARLGSLPLVVGDGYRLPFHDRTFDLVAMVTTLEFVTSCEQVLMESARVARRGLLIGALNRSSRLGRRLRSSGEQPWRRASLRTVAELRRVVAAVCRDLQPSIAWSTTLWPGLARSLRLPWGDFIGMAVRWRGSASTKGQTP